MRESLLRFAPSLVALLAFLLMGFLYLTHRTLYFQVLQGTGINPWDFPFLDAEFVFTMKDCWQRGFDIYALIPCDSVPGNKMPYSPLWPRLPFPTARMARIPVGIVTDIVFILSVSLFLPRARSVFDSVLITLAMLSTMVVFAMERNNVDVWIYLWILAGVLIYMRGGVASYLSYGMFFFVTLLKYYPIAMFILALRERPRTVVLLGALCVIGLAVFWFVFRTELPRSLANVPGGRPFSDLVGIANLPRGILEIAADTLKSNKTIEVISVRLMRAVVMLGVLAWGWWISRRVLFRTAFASLAPSDAIWLVMGCSVMSACYLAGQSISYRGIFLMPVITGLLAMRRQSGAGVVATTAVLCVIPLMWMEAIRFWTAMPVDQIEAARQEGWLWIVMWGCREVLWLGLAGVMIAVLLVYIENSPAFRQSMAVVVRYFPGLPWSPGAAQPGGVGSRRP
jgi:hypothetical protein